MRYRDVGNAPVMTGITSIVSHPGAQQSQTAPPLLTSSLTHFTGMVNCVRGVCQRWQTAATGPVHADWIKHLPAHERRIARSLNALTQQAPTQTLGPALPASANALLAIAGLGANAAHSAQQDTIMATHLFEQQLQQLPTTPPLVYRSQLIQQIIDTQLESPQTVPVQSMTMQQDRQASLIRLALPAPDYNMLEALMLAYADSQLSALGLPEDLLAADYLYQYTVTDAQGTQSHMDMATLTEILAMQSGAPHVLIAQREQVNIRWPAAITAARQTEIVTGMQRVKQFWQRLNQAQLLGEVSQVLTQQMPDFHVQMQALIEALCKTHCLLHCALSQQFQFTYTVRAANMHHQHVANMLHPVTTQTFTAANILLGQQRKWRSQYAVYNQETLVDSRHDDASSSIKKYVHSLQQVQAQSIFSDGLERLRRNRDVKALYQEYARLVIAQLPKHHQHAFQFSDTPWILIYPERDPTARDRHWASHHNSPDYLELDGWHHRRLPDFALVKLCAIPFHLVSLMTGKIYHFASFAAMLQERNNVPALAEEFSRHFLLDHEGDVSNSALRDAVGLSERYGQIIDWQIRQIDQMIVSHTEATMFMLANRIADSAFILALPSLALGPTGGLTMAALLAAGPPLMRAAASDSRIEQESYLLDAAFALALEATGNTAEKVLLKALKIGIKKIYTRSLDTLRLPRKQLHDSQRMIEKLGQKFDLVCPSRRKRSDDSTLCRVGRRPLSTRSRGARRFDSSVSWINSASRFLFQLPSMRNLFIGRIRRTIINDIKPLGLLKLRNTQAVIGDPAYAEQIAIAAHAYFGQAFSVDDFLKRLHALESAFERLLPDNIRILDHASEATSFIAEIDIQQYHTGSKRVKFLSISKNNYQAYYTHMGKSKNAIADLLIHELSHGALNTMDFIYVGSRQYQNGAVNVFELINLSHRHLHVRQRQYISALAGADLPGLAGSSTDFGGMAGLHNADSVTQFISLLSKAKTDPPSFTRELAILEQAGVQSRQFQQRVEQEVLLSRARRSRAWHWHISPERFSNYLLVISGEEIALYIGVPPTA
ncbi:hypothetical protein FHW67_000552 [Herbaspirillum sp. Sphag1AN]|uniref:hypothetical protein n=1 Tax=unclassified Herbaspirillum TaxID=2624150 RepID=UPI001618284C|nr:MULTISPECIES: hypothetical protein [unclassified Herbaspirillum]MBB3211317.1 hypothetical protein [Herbaspirillum sp. Sphag1AN]MBB3244946.1 hypothetical protein [Herbaspirillum sp. Sphag64]